MERARLPSSGASALIVVPPLVKYATGPLLGPAVLAGAAQRAGHRADVVDLNARWIEGDLRSAHAWSRSEFIGDHDRDDALLRPMQERFSGRTRRHVARDAAVSADTILSLRADHEFVERAARRIAEAEGPSIAAQLARVQRPDLIAVSVLYSGQVLWALAATFVARERWPGVPVVWGGAHVTALADEIACDARYGFAADAFVAGYAEQTFVDLLDAIASASPWPRQCFRAGDGRYERAIGDDGGVVPTFLDLRVPKGARLTLPAQLSRGCAYGRCAYCTYPATEGAYRELHSASAEGVIADAIRRGARVSFKDSLLTSKLLLRAGELARGRVLWSGCTKLNPALDATMLRTLASQGCRTLEVGLETLLEDAQMLIEKRQSKSLFVRTLDAAADAGIALVVNYMTGFPGVSVAEEAQCFELVRDLIVSRHGRLVAKIEHNRFELERRAPFASALPAGVTITGSHPWSSLLDWSYTPSRRALKVMPWAGRTSPIASKRSSALAGSHRFCTR